MIIRIYLSFWMFWTKYWNDIYNNIWYDLKDHNMAPKQWISIRNIIIYLEAKCCPNRRIFVFWRPFWIQNGRHSKPKYLPYGAACRTPCNINFHWNLFIFEFIFIFFIFILAAILKILKTKSTTLNDDLFLCQV